MDFLQILGTLGLGSLIGIGFQYFLQERSHRSARQYDTRKEALIRAVAVVSGFGDRTVHFILSNSNSGSVNPIALIDYQAQINKEIAPALLFVDSSLREKLQKLAETAAELHDVVGELMKSKPIPADKKDPAAQKLSDFSKRISVLEDQIIAEMKKMLEKYS